MKSLQLVWIPPGLQMQLKLIWILRLVSFVFTQNLKHSIYI